MEGRATPISTTLQHLGLSAKERAALHLLLDNLYEWNFLSDVSAIDYSHNARDCALEPEQGVFVDDISVYSFVDKRMLLESRGRLYLLEENETKHANKSPERSASFPETLRCIVPKSVHFDSLLFCSFLGVE